MILDGSFGENNIAILQYYNGDHNAQSLSAAIELLQSIFNCYVILMPPRRILDQIHHMASGSHRNLPLMLCFK